MFRVVPKPLFPSKSEGFKGPFPFLFYSSARVVKFLRMSVGIISDTHGHLPAEVHRAFKGVALILHAGDIGNLDIIAELETIAPVHAVHGNIDDWPVRNRYPAVFDLELDGTKVTITHNIVTFQSFTFELFRNGRQADIVIFGHTHKAVSENYRNIQFINPGSVYRPKGGAGKSVAILEKLGRGCEPEFIYWD